MLHVTDNMMNTCTMYRDNMNVTCVYINNMFRRSCKLVVLGVITHFMMACYVNTVQHTNPLVS